MKKICNNYSLILFLIIFFSIALFYGILTQNMPISNDDMYFGLYFNHNNLIGTLVGNDSNFHGGKYIGLFVMRFLMYNLPSYLNIHISTFCAKVLPYINGIFLSLILCCIIYTYKNKELTVSPYLRLILYFLLFLYTIVGLLYYPTAGFLYNNYGFYRYFFSLIFFAYIPVYYLKILTNEELSIQNTILACFCSYVITTSIETLPILAILLILSVITFKRLFYKEKLKFFQSFGPLITIIITIIYLVNNDFVSVMGNRFASYSNIGNINSVIELLKNFSLYFAKYYVYNLIFLWITWFLFLFVKNQDKYSNRIKLFSIIYIISLVITFYLLIFCGRNYNDEIYIVHLNIRFLFFILFLFPLNYLFLYFWSSLKYFDKTKYKILLYAILAVYIIMPFIQSNSPKEVEKINREVLQDIYIAEKFIRYYTLKGKIPILPTLTGKSDQWNFLPFGEPNLPDEKDGLICFNNGLFLMAYYKSAYSKNKVFINKYCLSENAENIFKERGGILTEEELKKLDFRKLKDNNFILGKTK